MTIEEKYPEVLFAHFIALFGGEMTRKAYRQHAEQAMIIEGEEYLSALAKEMNLIEKNQDWDYFIQFAKEVGVLNIGVKEIAEMKEEIVNLIKHLGQ